MVTGEPGDRGVNAARIVIKANITEKESVSLRNSAAPTLTSHVKEAVPGTKSPATSTRPVPVRN